MMTWAEVESSRQYRVLSPAEKEAAKRQYFDQVVRPQVPEEDLPAAESQFFAATAQPAAVAQPSAPEPLTDRAKRIAQDAAMSDTASNVAAAGGTVARGVMGLPSMIGQAGAEAWNATTPAQSWLANKLGYENVRPETLQIAPENMPLNNLYATTTQRGELPGGRVLEGALGALTGAGVAGAVAKVAPAGRVGLKTMAATLAERPVLQGVSGATAAGAADATQAMGGGPAEQFVAGLVGGILPSATVSRAKAIAMPSPAQAMERKSQFSKAGINNPTLGQLTQKPAVQNVEGTISKTPGAVGVMREVREGQQDALGAKVDEIADRLSPAMSAERAGDIISKGLTGEGGFVDRFQAAQKIAYGKLDALIPPQMRVTPQNTLDMLDSLAAPKAGAVATTGGMANTKLRDLRDNIMADIQANGRPSVAGAPAVAGIPYEALAAIRSRVGAMMTQDEAISGAPRAELKRVYAALSEDLRAAARQTGNPKAEQAFDRANKLTRAGHARVDSVLQSVIDKKVPEMVYASATNMADMKMGASRIRTVLKSLNPDEADVVRSMFLRRLGTAVGGRQNAEGDAFSSETFLTNWAGKISEEAKAALFGRKGMRAELDAIAKTAADIRANNAAMGNPSGTAQNMAPFVIGGSAIGSGGTAIAMGQVAPGVAMLMSPLLIAGAANKSAKLLTNEKFIMWLADTIKNKGAIQTQGALQGLANVMKDQSPEAQAQSAAYIQQVESQGQQ